MSEAAVRDAGEGRLELSGVLDFDSVSQLWPALRAYLGQGEVLVLSLAGVEQANSAALVLLLEAREQAQACGRELRLESIPDNLRELAELSGVRDLLGLD